MTHSTDTPSGMLDPPAPGAFPAAAPHSVAPDGRTRWTSGITRWWHAIFARNPYARGPDTVRSGRSGHRFFQHLIEPEGEAANDASARGEAAGK